jgi:hypothetical protein
MEERWQQDLAGAVPSEITELRNSAQPVWIFAYGSLIWDPEFFHTQAEQALLRGYHRSFCLYSYDYRGTLARPGLTLGLDRGRSCVVARDERAPGLRRAFAAGEDSLRQP